MCMLVYGGGGGGGFNARICMQCFFSFFVRVFLNFFIL